MINNLKKIIKDIQFFKNLSQNLDNEYQRDDFVINQLQKLNKDSLILDAGCGSQRYRKYCSHLKYYAQDFGLYTADLKKMIGSEGGGKEIYKYGKLDYVGDIWDINEKESTFDTILCTEVFEHIPHPIKTLKEFNRLLRKGGQLILTAPSNCLRHMDPYFFYTGFSDRWYEKFLKENGFKIKSITAIGDYYSWLAVEMYRTAKSHSIFAKLALVPAFLFFYNKNKSKTSIDTLCMGYHIVAEKN
jgi:SAM-dependent methyltransferase